MQIAFIGIGGIAGNYRRVLASLRRPVAAVCDVDPRVAQRVAEEEKASAFHDHRRMLADVAPDVVFVCLPPGEHTTQVADAAALGAAIFVAKPVALNPGVAIRTRDMITDAGVINQVGYHLRYSDPAVKAKQMLGDRRIALGAGRYLFRMKAGHPWWGDAKKSGGQIVEQTTLVVDLLRHFLGEVDQVQAWGVRDVAAEPIADFEEASVMNLFFASGAVGAIASACTAPAEEGASVELVGDDVYLKITETKLTGSVDGQPVEVEGVERGYFRQIKRFLEAVEMHDQSLVLCDYADAVKTLAVTLAANLSMRNGHPVQVRQG